MEVDHFSPHYVTLDGLIRAKNSGCISIEEVLSLLNKVGYITDEENKLYDLFGLSAEDCFKIKGYTYEGFSCADNFKELIEVCKDNTGLIYRLINNPEKIEKLNRLDGALRRK